MTVWQELVSTALVGTERRSFSLQRVTEVVNGSLPRITADGAEAQVLAAAAVLAAYRRAGRRPDRGNAADLPDEAPPDDRPICSETASQLLSLLLDGMVKGSGGNTELIDEWLTACAAAQRRPRPRLAVALLDLGTAERRLRPAIAKAVGPLAAWLGRANSDWSWTATATVDLGGTAEDLEDRYARAPRSERVALLLAVRARNREAARHLLTSTWSSEPAAERAALLETLALGIDDDDEPFLETVLDDRAASVRRLAAALLDRLPRSRRAQRMAERARRLVRLNGRFRRLVVELPETIDAEARRDGITDQRDPGTGIKAAWLSQIVAATPLETWEDHLSLSPEEAVRLGAGETELIVGWQRAAVNQRDQRWASVLLARHVNPDLLAVVPPEHAQAFLRDVIGTSVVPDAVVPTLVAAVPGPWPQDVAGRVVQRVRQMPAILVSMTVPLLASRLDPASLPVVEAWIERMPEQHLRREVQALAHTLSIRQTIQREFA